MISKCTSCTRVHHKAPNNYKLYILTAILSTSSCTCIHPHLLIQPTLCFYVHSTNSKNIQCKITVNSSHNLALQLKRSSVTNMMTVYKCHCTVIQKQTQNRLNHFTHTHSKSSNTIHTINDHIIGHCSGLRYLG